MLFNVGFPLSNLTRRYQDKVKNLLKGGNHIDINMNIVYFVINQVLKYYLDR